MRRAWLGYVKCRLYFCMISGFISSYRSLQRSLIGLSHSVLRCCCSSRDSPRTGVRLHGECDQGVKAELAKTKLQRCKRAFGGQSLTPKTRNEAVQEFDSWRERHVEWYPFQTQNTGKVASHIESPWSKSVGVPMLLDARHLAERFLRGEEPGKVFPYADRGSFLRIRRGPRARSAGAPLAALRGSPPHVSVQSRKTAQCLIVICPS